MTLSEGKTTVASGFSYVETLVAVTLIAICIVPALQALGTALSGVDRQDQQTIDYLAVRSRLENVLAKPVSSIAAAALPEGAALAPSLFSVAQMDTPDGRKIDLDVYVTGYDGDNGDGDNNPLTGTDSGLYHVAVLVKGTALKLETLVSR